MAAIITKQTVAPSEWANAGFSRVTETAQGSIFDAWHGDEHYRIEINHALSQAPHGAWDCSIYVAKPMKTLSAIPAGTIFIEIETPHRIDGETPEAALRAGMRWVQEHAVLSPMSFF